jgi:hypothetical protein
MFSGTPTMLGRSTSYPLQVRNCAFFILSHQLLKPEPYIFVRLIWNLMISGKTSIEYVLSAHYRAITDINWHNTECNTVVSTGIDSWLWAWDLREPRKPIFGLSAFNGE